MNDLVEKVASVLPTLEECGEVYLFAMAEREGVNRWDIILSAAWADEHIASAIGKVIDALAPRLSREELLAVSRVAVIASDDSNLTDMPASLDGITPRDRKLIQVSFLGADVRRAYVFKSKIPPSSKGTGALLEEAAHA